MKKLLFIVCLIGMSVVAMAQNKSIDRVFDKYSGQEGFTTVYISKYMFSMFANLEGIEDEELEDVQDVFGKLTGIKILVVEDEDALGEGVNFYDEIMKDLQKDQYKELMVVKNSESDVVILAREEGGVIVELLLIVGGEGDNNALIAITGEIDLKTIAKLSETMDIDGMDQLEKLEDQ
ncbi:MAG TPA: DUF4252 domain-containing protein [Bacteroides sp.]|nr:DUF4252 domain-containing protein [Bacteroides sp.]